MAAEDACVGLTDLLPDMSSELTSRPEVVGMDGARLDSNLGTLLQRWVTSKAMPTAEALVARKGKVVWRQCTSGVRSDQLYRIYSMTKPITSVAVLMLVERGLLHLHEPVHLYLGSAWRKERMRVSVPDNTTDCGFKLVPCQKSVTVHMLMTHTSGVTYGFQGSEIVNPVAKEYQQKLTSIATGFQSTNDVLNDYSAGGNFGCKSLAEFADRVAGLPLCFQPGSHWHYGHNTDILGRIVEVISGKPLSEFFYTEIFQPLGMVDTAFGISRDDSERIDRLADLWYHNSSEAATINITAKSRLKGEHELERVHVPSGGGGLVSTTADYFRFCQMLLDGGIGPLMNGRRIRILSRKHAQAMTTNQLRGGADMAALSLTGYTEVAGPGQGFGLGVSVTLDPVVSREATSAGTVGWGGLASTLFYIDPVEEIIVIFMTQLIGLNELLVPRRIMLSNVVSSALIDGSLSQRSQRSNL